MPIGTVKFFNASKGYGFIQQEDGGEDAFVHISAVEKAGLRSLQENQRVSYDLEQGNRGRSAAVNLLTLEQGEPAPATDAPASPGKSSHKDQS